MLTRGTRWYQVPPVETPPGQSEGAADGDVLWVTPLFQWYGGDFEQTDKSVPDYIAKYDDAIQRRLVHEDIPKISYLNYDWKLNSQANAELAANAAEAAMPQDGDQRPRPTATESE